MKTIHLIILLTIIALLIGGAVTWKLQGDGEGPSRDTVKQAQETVQVDPKATTLTQEQTETAEAVVEVFTHKLTDALLEKDAEEATAVKDTLSERGQNVVAIDEDIFAGLKRFLRVDVPQSISIKSTTKKTASFAEAITDWTYADNTNEEYYIYLIVEDNRWRVDSIQTVQQ